MFRSVMALGAYRRDLRRAILALKYGGAWDLAFPLGSRLGGLTPPPVDLLVPVPLHLDRLRKRRYNQAELLTRVLASVWHLPWRHGLRRRRPTAPQMQLDRAARATNVAGAFAATSLRGRVGLVDDVFTSGATVQAAAGALLAAGASEVHVVVVARAVPPPWERL